MCLFMYSVITYHVIRLCKTWVAVVLLFPCKALYKPLFFNIIIIEFQFIVLNIYGIRAPTGLEETKQQF